MKVEKGIPIPGPGYRPRTEATRAFATMEAGDSILLTSESDLITVQHAGRRLGWKITSMKTDGGWRVWRKDGRKNDVEAPPKVQAIRPEPVTDEARAQSLHGLACAQRMRPSMDEARRWAKAGVSDAELRAAIARARAAGTTTITLEVAA